jgi:phosphoribosyl-ATP pyrophosphohydrolase
MKFLDKLYRIINKKTKNKEKDSYSYAVYKNPKLLRKKIIEEANELIRTKNKKQAIWETSDLLYFLIVFLVKRKVKLIDVEYKLIERNLIKSRKLKQNERRGNKK